MIDFESVFSFLRPKYSHIGVVSPAGLPDENKVRESIRLLRQCGFQVTVGDYVLEKSEEGYCCGTIAHRAADFNRMIHDESVDLIYCTRGGYGSAQILPLLDFDTLREKNLPVLGYSDISAIHLAMLSQKAGIPVAAPMLASLKNTLEREDCATFYARGWDGPYQWNLNVVSPDSASAHACSGNLIVSNLSILASLCGSPWLPDFHHAVLLLEDINEKIRVLDRHLTQLMLSGILPRVQCVVFGYLTECGDSDAQIALMKKFADLSGKDFFYGLPFGHEQPCLTLKNGASVMLNSLG